MLILLRPEPPLQTSLHAFLVIFTVQAQAKQDNIPRNIMLTRNGHI